MKTQIYAAPAVKGLNTDRGGSFFVVIAGLKRRLLFSITPTQRIVILIGLQGLIQGEG